MSRAGSAVCDDLVGYRLLDDHLVLRLDRDLRVVADGDPRMRRPHRAAVGIGQRDLVLADPVKLSQHRLATAALLAQGFYLLGKIFRARPAGRRAVFGVARVEPREIIAELRPPPSYRPRKASECPAFAQTHGRGAP